MTFSIVHRLANGTTYFVGANGRPAPQTEAYRGRYDAAEAFRQRLNEINSQLSLTGHYYLRQVYSPQSVPTPPIGRGPIDPRCRSARAIARRGN